jgi:hypothetical protein
VDMRRRVARLAVFKIAYVAPLLGVLIADT